MCTYPLLCRLTAAPLELLDVASKGDWSDYMVCLFGNAIVPIHVNLKVKKCSALKDRLTYLFLRGFNQVKKLS